MKSEWSDLFNLSPALLYKSDLLALAEVLYTLQEGIISDSRIQLTNKDQNIEASSFHELFTFTNLPTSTDKLSIDCINWKVQGENRYNLGTISLTLYHNYISCYICSRDEEWFRGKREKIKNFFATKKPWYSSITIIAPLLFPMFVIWPLQYAFFSLAEKKIFTAEISFATFVLFLVLGILTFKRILFPYVKIILREKTKHEVDWNFVFAIIMVLAALIEIFKFITTYKK